MKFFILGVLFAATVAHAETIVLGEFNRSDAPKGWNKSEVNYIADAASQGSVLLKLQKTTEHCSSHPNSDFVSAPDTCTLNVVASRALHFHVAGLVHENKKFILKTAMGDVVCAEVRKVGLLVFKRSKLVATGKCIVVSKLIDDAAGTYEVTLTVK